MLRKYSIHKEGFEPVGYLYYNEETEKYSLDIVADMNTDMPAILYLAAKIGRFHLDDDMARQYVKEHIIPPDCAGISDILAILKFPYYSEIFFLDKFRGKSVMDEFLIERVV